MHGAGLRRRSFVGPDPFLPLGERLLREAPACFGRKSRLPLGFAARAVPPGRLRVLPAGSAPARAWLPSSGARSSVVRPGPPAPRPGCGLVRSSAWSPLLAPPRMTESWAWAFGPPDRSATYSVSTRAATATMHGMPTIRLAIIHLLATGPQSSVVSIVIGCERSSASTNCRVTRAGVGQLRRYRTRPPTARRSGRLRSFSIGLANGGTMTTAF